MSSTADTSTGPGGTAASPAAATAPSGATPTGPGAKARPARYRGRSALSPSRLGGPDALARADAFLARLEAEPGARLPGARRHARRHATEPHAVPAALLAELRTLAGD